MSSRAPDLLSSIFSIDRRPDGLAALRGAVSIKLGGAASASAEVRPRPMVARRTMIWDMHHSVHCSIIGTCLAAAELRRLLIKLGVEGAESADDHTLHKQGVAIAGQPQDGGRFIQKALDRRHHVAIKQCAGIEGEDGLLRFWEDSLGRGEVPGAYWATLSHPAATERLMRRAFGDVHMLSHMIGAANRADIRRLRLLEEENAALAVRIELQQRQLREGFVARDEKIRLLSDALSRVPMQGAVDHASDDVAAATTALADIRRRLSREIARRERLDARIDDLTSAHAAAECARQVLDRDNQDLRRELAIAEAQIDGLLAHSAGIADGGADAASEAGPALAGTLVLYVGGRAHQIPQLKALVERVGGAFLHHDGGIEHAMTLLPGLISRAGCVVFPTDCVSHDAMGTVKRLCRQSGKPFIPLRTASLASLLSGISMLQRAPHTAAAD